MKLKLLLLSNQKYRKSPQSIKIYPSWPGKGGFLTLRMGDAPCTYLGSEIWSKQDCLKSREGEVIRATVFLYLYELIFSHKFSND